MQTSNKFQHNFYSSISRGVQKSASTVKIEHQNDYIREQVHFSIDNLKNKVKIQPIVKEQPNIFIFSHLKQQLFDQPSLVQASDDLDQGCFGKDQSQSLDSIKTIKKLPIYQDPSQFYDVKYEDFSESLIRYEHFDDASKNQVASQDSIKETKEKRIVKKGSQRKIRTTITKQKLQSLNVHLKQFFEYKDKLKDPPLNLRQISKQLNLSYSTTIHKASIFRKEHQLKPGVLLSSLTKKRKYKKSEECQKYIQQSLKMRPFYTAQSLAKFIFRTFGISYPRSIIGRHLGEMGYSCNNIRAYSIDKNRPAFITLRKVYANILQPFLLSPLNLVYVDQFAFSKNIFHIKTTYSTEELQKQMRQTQEDYVSVIIAMNCQRIIYYDIKYGFYDRPNFIKTIGQIHRSFIHYYGRMSRNFCLINDLHKIHYDSQQNVNFRHSVSSTLVQNDIKRLFIPPGSSQLNPVQLVTSNLKKKLQRQRLQIVDCESLRIKLIKFMKQIASEPTKPFFYEFQKWFLKAKQGIPF